MLRFFKSMIIMMLALIPICAGAFTVVIDAGHGGRDSGCRGENTLEKDVTLDVAKMLADLIADEYGKKVNVVLTRDDDTFVTLQRRAEIANTAKADIFISIHVNSVADSNPRRLTVEGSQVYVLSDTKTSGKISSIKGSAPIATANPGTSGTKAEDIGYSIASAGAAKLSSEMAGYAMKRLRSTADRADMGIRQAGFQVLWATAMPAVLVELDYMCNPEQEKFLASEKGRKKCAKALFEAFGDYYAAHAPAVKAPASDKAKGSSSKKDIKAKSGKSGKSKK